MNRRTSTALAASALALTACSDVPSSISGDPVRPTLSMSGVVCDVGGVQRTINRLYFPGTTQAAAHVRFSAGHALVQQGDVAGAWQEFGLLLQDLMQRFNAGGLNDPRGALSTADGVLDIAERIAQCAGGGSPDVAVGLAQPGSGGGLVVGSKQFSFEWEDDFFDGTALVILRRIYDTPPFSPLFAEYPPRFNIGVFPYTAQENFDDDGDGVNDPGDVVETGTATALVSVCPGDPHPASTSLSVLRNPEPFLNEAPHLLDRVPPGQLVLCDEVPPFTPPSGSLLSRLPGASQLRGAAAAVWRVLGPTPLYAVDGGIGGRPRLASDYVAATPVLQVNILVGETDYTSETYYFQNLGAPPVTFTAADESDAPIVSPQCSFTLPDDQFAYLFAQTEGTGTLVGNTVDVFATSAAFNSGAIPLTATCGGATATVDLLLPIVDG